MTRLLALAWALILPWAYVLPPERVLQEVAKARPGKTPLSLLASLEGTDPSWPTEVQIDLHPLGGVRIDDQRGGRWVLRRGRIVAASQPLAPVWLPQIEALLQPSVDSLSQLLIEFGVDSLQISLARCGADDCFVLGQRDGGAQLWIEKDAFEPRAWVLPTGRRFEWSAYRSWGKIKFPSQIGIFDGSERLATLRTLRVEPAPGLRPEDFSDRWARL